MSFGIEDFEVVPLLYKVAHKCSKLHNERVKKFSINGSQIVVLGMISFLNEGEVNQKKISEKLGIRESSVSSIIKTMIKNEIIYKEKSKSDGRNYILKLTPKGREIGNQLEKDAGKFEELFFKPFSSDEKEEFKRLLLKLV